MVTDNDTNKVYLSAILANTDKYKDILSEIDTILRKYKVSFELLKNTADIWCRDYMPIQVSDNKFVQFRYEPTYLEGYPDLRTDPAPVCDLIGINPFYSDINLDGGNIVKWKDRVVMSERIFHENPDYTGQEELISKVEGLLEAEVILIPDIKSDLTGHADGMIRFVDRDTVIINRLKGETLELQRKMRNIFSEKLIRYIEMPWFEDNNVRYSYSAIGCYVNYLEVGNLIIFPVFETLHNHDREAFDIVSSLFKGRQIETININTISREGGLMNCITWNMKK